MTPTSRARTASDGPIRFGIVGTGWRTDFFLRIAREAPERFEVAGVVSRDAARAASITERWSVPGFIAVDDMVRAGRPDFVVLSVPRAVATSLIADLAVEGVPVLTETPPATDAASAAKLFTSLPSGARVQVAEQYHLSPLLSAQLAVAASGLLGAVSQVLVSQCHDYHGTSVLRRALGVGFEDATVSASSFDSPLVSGPDRTGDPEGESVVTAHQLTARFDFGDRLGIYDFAAEQYFSWIRGNRLLVRGERGEIDGLQLRYLRDHRTPVFTQLTRVDTGEGGNLEGKFLRGILAGERWAFENPFPPARLNDDEIAIARCLVAMDEYIAGGPPFYSLAEASQDLYLAQTMKEAARTGEALRTERQVWAPQ